MSPLRAPPLACWSISAALELPRSREQQNLCVFPPFFPEVLGWSEGILLGALCCCLVSLELSHPILGGLREHGDLWNPVWRLEAPVGAFSQCPQLQLAPEVVRAGG